MNPPNPPPVGNRGTRHESAKPDTNWDGVRHKGPQIASRSLRKEGAGKTSEQIELLQLDKSGIKVAEYMTELPKRKLLE